MDPVDEFRAIIQRQLLSEARIGGDIECILMDPEYRDPRDESAFFFDINCMDVFGDTALHHAVQSNSVENIKHLIEADGCDVDPQNFNGDTPLHLAVKIKDRDTRHEIVSLLVKTAGATDSIRLANRAGQTPNALAKIYFPDDTEVNSLTTPPARQLSDILGKSDIARDDESGHATPE